MMLSLLASLMIVLSTGQVVAADDFGKWCGKYYQIGAPIPNSRPEGSLFPYPEISSSPLLDFRCVAASSLYLQGDEANDKPMILVDTNITNDVGQSYHGDWSGTVTVSLFTDNDHYLGTQDVPLNRLGSVIPIDITALKAQATPYNLTCKGQINGQTYYASSQLRYLPPNPYGGNTVKIDRRSGSLLVRNETAQSKTWEKLIPYGFYDSYNSTCDPSICGPGYGSDPVNDTLNRLHLAKSLGLNLVHPVPPGGFAPYTFDAQAAAQFEKYLDTAEQLGLYIQYDMRNSFLNLSSVQYQVEMLRNRSNIIAWYTGDEPDGAVYALNSTKLAYDLLYEIDGYHPVSLVLNCENYFFEDYGLKGADIIMVDPYPIAMNPKWSKPYNTIVNENYGDSGCDNCNGTFSDITTRIDSARNRARLAGVYREKPAWIVPQAFNDGGQEFWFRVPTGSEGQAVSPILAINHGATGSVAWNSQYSSADLLSNASSTSALIRSQSRFLIDAADSRKTIYNNLSYPIINGYDLASWTIHNSNNTGKTETLIMAVNTNYGPNDAGPSWQGVFGLANYTGKVSQVLAGNVSTGNDGGPVFYMPRTSIAAVILQE